MNLYKKPKEKIIQFLFNGKKGDTIELSPERSNEKTEDIPEEKEILIYQDKSMKVYFSYLIIEEDDVIEQFIIYSRWWGKIKNSFFTINGEKGKFTKVRCGVINSRDLETYQNQTNHPINNKNKVADIKVTNFDTFVKFWQRKYGESPSYKVRRVVSPLVEIEVYVPKYGRYTHQGHSKKAAANEFAQKFIKENKF